MTAQGDLTEKAPEIYQTTSGKRRVVAGRFKFAGNTTYGFEVAAHDTSVPLVIDPTIVFSTYLGGLGEDSAAGVAIDAGGNSYVAGYTASLDFPIQNGLQDVLHIRIARCLRREV